MARVAFLGLGVMGFPMAGHLAAAGHEVTVWNRTAAKAAAWAQKHGGRAAATAREAAQGAEFVMCCVGNDDDLRAVCALHKGMVKGYLDTSGSRLTTGDLKVGPTCTLALVPVDKPAAKTPR